MKLTASQQLAIKHISSYAKAQTNQSLEKIGQILYQSNINKDAYELLLSSIKRYGCIALHFHPDRLLPSGGTIADGLLEVGHYRSQFETGVSSGSVSAFRGGHRAHWENRIFQNAYGNAAQTERPKYGALNLTVTCDGPAPRFGSCFFLLKPEVKNRATFSYGDTHESPKELGTMQHFELIMAALFQELFTRGTGLGAAQTVGGFVQDIAVVLPQPHDIRNVKKPSHNLDFYIEAQVHGAISLQEDVEILVADFSFQQTPIGEVLERLCERYTIKLQWNNGLFLEAESFPDNYRGPQVPTFAKKFAKNGKLDAFAIGEAAKQLRHDYDNLQMMKYLWHCLVRFGKEIRKNS